MKANKPLRITIFSTSRAYGRPPERSGKGQSQQSRRKGTEEEGNQDCKVKDRGEKEKNSQRCTSESASRATANKRGQPKMPET